MCEFKLLRIMNDTLQIAKHFDLIYTNCTQLHTLILKDWVDKEKLVSDLENMIQSVKSSSI